jgi:hypothetical protein
LAKRKPAAKKKPATKRKPAKKPTNRIKRAKAGQPPKLTDAKKKAVIAYISSGGSQRLAAMYVGCHHSTIRNEADRDPQFLAGLTRAEGQCALELLEAVHDHATDDADGDWRAAAWLLERKFPKDFGKDRDDAAEQEPTQIIKILVETRHEAEQYVKMSSLLPQSN